MLADTSRPPATAGIGPRIALAATFTAEPILEPLAFWMRELGSAATIEFAPYAQVFQELLNPGSLLSGNRGGVNVVLLRIEDWLRSAPDASAPEKARALLGRNANDFIAAVQTAAGRAASPPLVLALCPSSPAGQADPVRRLAFPAVEQRIVEALANVSGVSVVGPQDLAEYPVGDSYDAERDALGHTPYTPAFLAALATALARRIHALGPPRYKVVVLDCDNTLWQGVVGEEGALGVAVTPGCRALQEFVLRQIGKGFVVCLCSKNEERDALEVFDRHPDMVLRREHLVGWRINWGPKSENLRSLASELNLGLESFIFLDDNPVECAEVRARCPEVLTLRVPPADEVGRFLEHLWAFDRLTTTEEDRRRTTLYRENAERSRLQEQAGSFQEFLDSLELRVEIHEPAAEQWSRVSQLTQRTNQFNFTTIRRSEAEVRGLAAAGLECRVVEVCDRFGDHGLVGVLIHGKTDDAVEVDSFLLSCRVLGRGVEHRMLNDLGKLAQGLGLSRVVATLVPTAKNLPARRFLDRVAGEWKEERDGRTIYRIPADCAAAAAPDSTGEPVDEDTTAGPARPAASEVRSAPPYERIAHHLHDASQVLEELARRGQARRDRPNLGFPPTPPSTNAERQLHSAWSERLGLEAIGIHDDYFELGGTSLLAVDLLAQIERLTGVHLPVTAIVEAPTIASLALLLEGRGPRDSLVPLRLGGDKPPVFLIHDGNGETIHYRNLALRLGPDHPVYGMQPQGSARQSMLHTRIGDMAAHHVRKIRGVQPRGPYFIGGMCAGGVIAFEIARQLQAAGETVGLVALLESADVEAKFQRSPVVHPQPPTGAPSAPVPKPTPGPLRRAAVLGGKVVRKARRHASDAWLAARMTLYRHYVDRGVEPPAFLGRPHVRIVYRFAESSYRPRKPYQGALTLFRATSGIGGDRPFQEVYNDPLLGWASRATEGVRPIDVPGGHASMFREPNVRVLAQHIRTIIDEVQAAQAAECPETPGGIPEQATRTKGRGLTTPSTPSRKLRPGTPNSR